MLFWYSFQVGQCYKLINEILYYLILFLFFCFLFFSSFGHYICALRTPQYMKLQNGQNEDLNKKKKQKIKKSDEEREA